MAAVERFWPDGCDHPEDAFLGTVHVGVKPYDVYVFGSPAQVCIRYGKAPHEYLSPGPLANLCEAAARSPAAFGEEYKRALKLIRRELARQTAAMCRARGEGDSLFHYLAAVIEVLAAHE